MPCIDNLAKAQLNSMSKFPSSVRIPDVCYVECRVYEVSDDVMVYAIDDDTPSST